MAAIEALAEELRRETEGGSLKHPCKQSILYSLILQEREEQLAANEASAEELRRETVAAADRAQAQRLDADRAARALQAERAELQVRSRAS